MISNISLLKRELNMAVDIEDIIMQVRAQDIEEIIWNKRAIYRRYAK